MTRKTLIIAIAAVLTTVAVKAQDGAPRLAVDPSDPLSVDRNFVPPEPEPEPEPEIPVVFTLRAGDVIDISVLEDPTLNTRALIRPDGRISLPIAGTIEVGGRTPEEVQSAIRQALSRDFVQPPTVTVSLASLGDGRRGGGGQIANPNEGVFIIGQVARQGRLSVRPPVDILRALALSGGLETFAARDRIQVRRREGNAETILFFDYNKIEDGLLPGGTFDLIDGDIVVVPERGLFE